MTDPRDHLHNQGIHDGVLHDARSLSGSLDREEAATIVDERFQGEPMYLTAAVYNLIAAAARHPEADWAGIIWDLLAASREAIHRAAARAADGHVGREAFTLFMGNEHAHLDAVVDGGGLLTITMPGET